MQECLRVRYIHVNAKREPNEEQDVDCNVSVTRIYDVEIEKWARGNGTKHISTKQRQYFINKYKLSTRKTYQTITQSEHMPKVQAHTKLPHITLFHKSKFTYSEPQKLTTESQTVSENTEQSKAMATQL